MKNRRPKNILAATLISVPVAFASAQTTVLQVQADVQINAGSPDTNVESDSGGFAMTDESNMPFRKAWLKFDASGLANDIESIDSMVFSTLGSINRTTEWFLLEGGDVDDWTESGITWNNAPGNNTSGEGFSLDPGESADKLFNITMADEDNPLTVTFDGSANDANSVESDAETLLLDALNNGNRQATIAVEHVSSKFSNLRTKEGENLLERPDQPRARIEVTELPEPAGVSLFLGLGALTWVAGRRAAKR